MSPSGKYRARRGYTLFELLLSLGLAAALLVLISTAIGLFERYSSAGRARAEQSQIIRALLDRMETDLRSVVFRERQFDLDENSSLIIPIGALSVEQEFSDRHGGEEWLDGNLGIIGDERHLLLHVDQVSRVKLKVDAPVPAMPGLRYIVWACSTTPFANRSGQQQAGLTRFELGKLPPGFDPNKASIQDLILAGKFGDNVLASEVTSIRFRYLDHDGWQASWNSLVNQRLPRSIEVTFNFASRSEIPDANQQVRAVIPVLLSEPFTPQLGSQPTLGGL